MNRVTGHGLGQERTAVVVYAAAHGLVHVDEILSVETHFSTRSAAQRSWLMPIFPGKTKTCDPLTALRLYVHQVVLERESSSHGGACAV